MGVWDQDTLLQATLMVWMVHTAGPLSGRGRPSYSSPVGIFNTNTLLFVHVDTVQHYTQI